MDEAKGLEEAKKGLKSVMERLHVVIIGPGLGRTDFTQSCAREALRLAKDLDIGVVIDADGLWLLNSEPELVKDWEGVPRVVLTPNVMEFKRLCSAMVCCLWGATDKQGISDENPQSHCADLARAMGNVTIIQKGGDDIISNGIKLPKALLAKGQSSTDTLVDSTKGGLKRVGGQGDILSGTTGTLLAWGREWARGAYKNVGHKPDDELAPHIPLIAAYGASAFNRNVSRQGFADKGRSMVTHDLVDLVGPVYKDMFGKYTETEDEDGVKGKL